MQFSIQKMRLRSSYQTLCRSTWRRRWRSETVASNSSHFESHAVSKHVATTLTSGAPGRKNVETTAAIGVRRIFSGVGGSGRRPVNPPTPEGSGVGGRHDHGVEEKSKRQSECRCVWSGVGKRARRAPDPWSRKSDFSLQAALAT